MVKTFFGILLFLCSLGIPIHALPPSDNSGTNIAAQDGTGTVWAISNDGNGTLNRWEAGKWAIQIVPGTDGFRLNALTRGDNGFVYALWQKVNQYQNQTSECLITVHRGIYSHILARFPGPVSRDPGFPSTLRIFADSEGDVWVVGYQPLLWHITTDGTVTPFPIKPEQFFGGKPLTDYQSQVIESTVDGAGRRWFWQESTNYSWPQTGLRGVLIWDGKTLDYHATLSGVPDRPFSVVTPLDINHFWLAEAGDGYSPSQFSHGAVYRVDTHTLTAVPELPPARGAFQYVTQIFQANGEWYIVEPQMTDPNTVLWRRRDGPWKNCLKGSADAGGNSLPAFRLSWLSEPSGVWLGVSGGAWWLPHGDLPAVWADWHRGLPAIGASGLFPLTDGSILDFNGVSQSAEIPPVPQPIRPLPPGLVAGGMGAPKYLGPLTADPRHHLWGTRTHTNNIFPLDEWDGTHWRVHLPPKSIPGVNGVFACDTLGRIWLTTWNWHPPAQPQPVEGYTIYDPAHDAWTNYSTHQDALQAAAALPGMAFRPYHNSFSLPIFGGDGRVAYAYNQTVFLYDGKVWRQWNCGDILANHGGNTPDNLRFNQAGHLEVTLDVQICEWTLESGWQRTGEKKPANYVGFIPSGGPKGLWAVPAVDDLGRDWFTWHGGVYMSWHGLWTNLNALSAPGSPFKLGYGIEDVLRDPAGRLFFVSRPAGYYDFVVWTPPVSTSPPAPRIQIKPLANGSIQLRFTAAVPNMHWFLWRFNGGEWSIPQKSDTVLLPALPIGAYRVEAQTLNMLLQASPKYSTAAFVIQPASAEQIARWVKSLLSGTEDAREAAVTSLVKQPSDALPALQAARSGASEDGLWWLDAATQQINPAAD